jgi:tRNA A-37 threonylcarbamoyl transferase component Bud32
MTRFQRLQSHLSEWNEDMVRAPLAAWVDVWRRAWVLGEFNQGLPIVDRLASGGVDPGNAGSCLERVREIVRAGHRRGLVHGSIGNGNIIVTAHCDRAYLLDFGHAALLANDSAEPPAPSGDLTALDRLTAAVRGQTTGSLSQ